MQPLRGQKIQAIFIAATGFGMLLLRTLDIRRAYLPGFTWDLPDDTVQLFRLSGILDSVFGGINIALGVAIWTGKKWGRTALLVWALVWAALFTFGTFAKSQLFDLRAASYPFLVCLAFYFLSIGYLSVSKAKSTSEAGLGANRGEVQ